MGIDDYGVTTKVVVVVVVVITKVVQQAQCHGCLALDHSLETLCFAAVGLSLVCGCSLTL